jgi:hypothetical protein
MLWAACCSIVVQCGHLSRPHRDASAGVRNQQQRRGGAQRYAPDSPCRAWRWQLPTHAAKAQRSAEVGQRDTASLASDTPVCLRTDLTCSAATVDYTAMHGSCRMHCNAQDWYLRRCSPWVPSASHTNTAPSAWPDRTVTGVAGPLPSRLSDGTATSATAAPAVPQADYYSTIHQSMRSLKPGHARLQRGPGMRQEFPTSMFTRATRLACCLQVINTPAPAVLRSTSACRAPDMDHSRRRASRPRPPDDHTRPSRAATAVTVPSCAAASCPPPTPVHSRSYQSHCDSRE